MRQLIIHSIMLLITLLTGSALRAADPPAAGSQQMDEEIQTLIGQLGSDEFAIRERAQAALERLGLYAFDALRDAQEHEDVEIALRARYLVGRLQVNWFSDQDPPDVRRALREYGRLSETDRRSRMDRLAQLEEGQGIAALCRLVRFESDLRLAKYAALQVMKYGAAEDPEANEKRAQLLRDTVSFSKRTAAQWVRAYSRTLTDPKGADSEWASLVAEEQKTFANMPEQTTGELLVDLLRWRADQLLAQDRRPEAKPLIRDSLDLIGGRRDQLQAAMDWLIQRQAWEEIDQLAERFADVIQNNLLLRYRVAESHLQRGDMAESERRAAEALKSKTDELEEHIEAAIALQDRGLFSWAEGEYRQVMQLAGQGSPHDLRARFSLSEMLHDLSQDLAAAESLQTFIDAVDQDPEFAKRARPLMRPYRNDLEEVRARMHFFYAEHFKDKDRAKQKEHLEKAINVFPREIDVIIAMYHFPEADASWKQLTRQRLADTVGYYREQIQDFVQVQNLQPAEEGRIRQILAMYYNQLAWLICNTEGDLEEALRYSKQSLEYVPNTASYLDTLGRCYYSLKDYENAVRYQTRAAALEPHSGQIRRQLELFQKSLAEQQANRTSS